MSGSSIVVVANALRLRGRGLKGADGRRGDHYVELRVAMPPVVDDELAEFIRGWRAKNAYDPRADRERGGR